MLNNVGVSLDVLQEAFLDALERWPAAGIPANPDGWLFVNAQRKAIDRLRRAQVLAKKQQELKLQIVLEQPSVMPVPAEEGERNPATDGCALARARVCCQQVQN